MDFTTIIIIGVVLFVVVRILSSIAKKNKAKNAEQSGQQGQQQQQQQQPARPPAMSDIQRAFSMMSDEDTRPAPKPTPRPVARQAAAYSSTQGKSFSTGAGHEGNAGRDEGRASTHEGKRGKTEGREFHGVGAHNMPNPYQGVNLSSVTLDETEDDFGNVIGDKKYAPKPKLQLFGKQSDYMKAVIFSEILPRRSR